MVFTSTEIDKILAKKKLTTKDKEDKLLHADYDMYANLGTDSSKGDRNDVRVASKRIYSAIKTINKPLGTLLLQALDDK